MSKMGEHFLGTTADRADRDADEVARLRDKVTRLEAKNRVLEARLEAAIAMTRDSEAFGGLTDEGIHAMIRIRAEQD